MYFFSLTCLFHLWICSFCIVEFRSWGCKPMWALCPVAL
jgi:hypothetical protein